MSLNKEPGVSYKGAGVSKVKEPVSLRLGSRCLLLKEPVSSNKEPVSSEK